MANIAATIFCLGILQSPGMVIGGDKAGFVLGEGGVHVNRRARTIRSLACREPGFFYDPRRYLYIDVYDYRLRDEGYILSKRSCMLPALCTPSTRVFELKSPSSLQTCS